VGSSDADAASLTDAASSDADAALTDAAIDPRRILYTVQPASRASFLSVPGADGLCNASRPAGVANAKAVIAGTKRRACVSKKCSVGGAGEHIDWPLAANTPYQRADRTTSIGTTNALGFFDTLTNSVGTEANVNVWTGLKPETSGLGTDWTTSPSTCLDWASTQPSDQGIAAYPGPTFPATAAFGVFLDACSQNFVLYCAEVVP
jgi:hypothetical protein